MNNKWCAEESVHHWLDVRENTMTKNEEKAQVCDAFLTSVFKSKTSCF